ncbi:hypothetical protein [Pseudovibrio sp. SPO723]|uniref:hypothetical protein n=1 Tax=Nesiotobacter zosterae TaxID=392721 RepID=UPI0029C44D2B|nr:hypothetical protein [Pseudovibrio sp. SPO723]MDX5592580.1 hypothetical protein [Pseudovibrio sp. SPO723]
MDILSLIPRAIDKKIKHPKTGAYVGLTLTLRSPEDEVMQDALFQYQQSYGTSSAERTHAAKEFIVHAVSDWRFEAGDDGEQAHLNGNKAPKCSAENKRTVAASPIVRSQVIQEYLDQSNFYPA